MDIWAWVFRAREDLQSSGNERLSELIGEIPTAVIENRNDEVDALVPEALGLARSLNLDWVEIFLRHWHLQARGGGYEVVPEAVELLEFSHREEHRDCPQSVCTVQDLARAYQGADGPGYVQERLDVANETLARIDPSWPCFQCISIERATALIDIGRHQDALSTVEDMRRQQTAAGSGPTAESCVDAEALLRLGRAEEALRRLDEGDRRDRDRETTFSRFRRLRRTRVLAALGRTDEAAEALLEFDVVLADPAFAWYWADGVAALVDAGARENDWMLGAALERLVAGQVERGRAWDGVRIAAIHGRLALARNARSTAAHALETGRALAARLRDPSRGEAVLEALEAALAEAPDDDAHELPDSPEALLDESPEGEQPDAERAAERLAAGTRRWPDSHELALAHAGALDAMGRAGAAHRVLADFAERHPEDADASAAAGLAAILAGDGEAAEAHASRLEGLSPAYAAWVRARRAVEAGDHARAAELADAALAEEPEARGLRRLRLHSAEELGDWGAAREQVDALLDGAGEEETEGLRWSRMMAATALGDWDAVRETAAQVGMELPDGDGPVDEHVAPVRVSFGARDVLAAIRTGPVTARVVTVARPDKEQRAGTVVLFDPYPLDAPEDGPLLFRVRQVLEPGAVEAWPYDAIDPGEDEWQAFLDSVAAEGWLIDSYLYPQEHQPEGDRRLVYGMLAVPAPADAAAVAARLAELAEPLSEPVFWPVLLEAAGDADGAALQRERASDLGLLPD